MPKPPIPNPTRRRPLRGVAASILLCASGLAAAAAPTGDDLLEQQRAVDAAERAFAQSMADRDLDAFAAHVAADAMFFGGQQVSRGREAVLANWKAFFDGPQPPFSWAPDRVDVLSSGGLAHSTGPVRNPAGDIVGRFNSVWRLEADGRWRVIIDRGEPVCAPRPAPDQPAPATD